MITELSAHNFRTLVNARLHFAQRHLLIGKNNSGKSNVCLALSFLKAAAGLTLADAIQVVPGAYSDFCNYALGAKDRISSFGLSCDIDRDGTVLHYRYDLVVRVGDPQQLVGQTAACTVVSERLTVFGLSSSETVLLNSDGKTVRLHQEGSTRDANGCGVAEVPAPSDSTMLSKLYERETYPTASAFRDHLRGLAYFNLSAERIRWAWRERRANEGLWSHGDTLAQVIFQMKTASESRYRRVVDRMRRIEPKLVAINFLTGPEQNIVPIIELEGRGPASWASLSDGTLRLLALSFIVEQANLLSNGPGATPQVAIIEEPENSVYVGELRQCLDDFEDVAPTSQFILTTHSPYLIDLFDDRLEAVTLLSRRDWHTEARSLHEIKGKIRPALKKLPLGEQFFRELLE